MNLQSQLTSLPLSKRLKELNLKQESIWMWAKQPAISGEYTIHYFDNLRGEKNKFSAFSVAELGEILPDYILVDQQNKYFLHYWSAAKGWYIEYATAPIRDDNRFRLTGHVLHFEEADTEANARAKMLIYLIEQGIIKV